MIRPFMILACCWCAAAIPAQANSVLFTLGSPNNQNYSYSTESNVPVGPYSGTLTGSSLTLFFCADMALSSTWNTTYSGTAVNPSGEIQEEAAYLATLELYDGGESSNQQFVNTVEGPISLAIWELFGNMGSYPTDPAADYYIQKAQNAWKNLLNNPQDTPAQKALVQNWLSNVYVFSPNPPGPQRFIGAFRDDALISAEVPEAGSIMLVIMGFTLILLGRTRQLSRVLGKRR